MPSLAEQSVAQLGGPWSVLTRQKRDHVRLDRLLDDLDKAPGGDQERVLGQISRLVFPHAFAEESVLWPELRRLLPDGEQLTLQVEQEHQEVNEIWAALERRDLSPGEHRAALERLARVLREDVRDEEEELLPRLQETVGVARLRQLGIAWEVVRRTAPTRPHPVVSRRPPGNVLAALPLTLIDRSRDGLDAAARRTPDGAARHLRSASAALLRVAGRLEHVGALRRGEALATRRGPDPT